MLRVRKGVSLLLACYAMLADANVVVGVDDDPVSEIRTDESIEAILPDVPKACME